MPLYSNEAYNTLLLHGETKAVQFIYQRDHLRAVDICWDVLGYQPKNQIAKAESLFASDLSKHEVSACWSHYPLRAKGHRGPALSTEQKRKNCLICPPYSRSMENYLSFDGGSGDAWHDWFRAHGSWGLECICFQRCKRSGFGGSRECRQQR